MVDNDVRLRDRGSAQGGGQSPQRRLAGSLSTATLVFMVLAASAPLTFLAGGAPLGILIGNGPGFPAIFAVGTAILLLFSVGFTAMTRFVPRPGGFFVYVSHGLGARAGLGAAALALMVYTAVNIAIHALTGAILAQTLVALGGPETPWWAWSLVSIAVIGVLGYLRIDIGSVVLAVLLLSELMIMGAIVLAVILTGAHGQGLSAEPFALEHVLSGAPGVGLMFAMSAFIGFEAVAVFRDEARNPDRTVPRATYLAVLGIGAFYTLATWAIVMAWGVGQVVAETAEDPGALLLRTAFAYLGPAGETILNILLVTSLFACTLSLHNIITRYQHSIAFAGLSFRWLAHVHPRHGSPHMSSLFQTGTAAVLIILCAVIGLDPLLQTVAWASGVATLGVAVLLTVTSVAVIAYFFREHHGLGPLSRVVAPVAGLVGLLLVVFIMTINFPLLVGDADAEGNLIFGGLSIGLLLLIVLPFVIGAVHMTLARRTRPAAYQRFLTMLRE